jgi:hypothetical protein
MVCLSGLDARDVFFSGEGGKGVEARGFRDGEEDAASSACGLISPAVAFCKEGVLE